MFRPSIAQGDRFIPVRGPDNEWISNYTPAKGQGVSTPSASSRRMYFFSSESRRRAIAQSHSELHNRLLANNYYYETRVSVKLNCYKILDAPGLPLDFYSNLLAWSKSDRIYTAVSMDDCAWSIVSAPVLDEGVSTDIISFRSEYYLPSSILTLDKTDIITGWSDGSIKMYSLNNASGVPIFNKRSIVSAPIDTIAELTPNTFACGYKAGHLGLLDIRVNSSSVKIIRNESSISRIAGLAYNGGYCIASGSDDNSVRLWDLRNMRNGAFFNMTGHTSSVKALAFHPNDSTILLSGGGSACTCIYKTNIDTREFTNLVRTGNQITGIHWFPSDPKYLVTSYGYSGTTELVGIWTFNMDRGLRLQQNEHGAHEGRTISLAGSKTKPYFAVSTQKESLHFFKAKGVKSLDNLPTKKLPILASIPFEIR